MKRAAILIFVLSAWANATVFTATQSGDWNTATTWGGVTGTVCGTNIPCMTSTLLGGDQVIIPSTYVITCTGASEVCSAGTSPANQTTLAISCTGTGGLTVGSTATLIYAGPVHCGASGFTFTLDAGATVQYDSSWAAAPTTAKYNWVMATGNTGAQNLFEGTSGSHVTWQGDSSFSSLADSGVCSLGSCRSGSVGDDGTEWDDDGWGTYTYTDFKNCGQISSGYCFLLEVYAKNTSLTNSTFTNSAAYGIQQSASGGGGSVTLNGDAFTSCASTNSNYLCFKTSSLTASTATVLIENSIFDSGLVTGGQEQSTFTWRNDLMWASLSSGVPGQYPGIAAGDDSGAGTWDQVFFDNTGVTTGTGTPTTTTMEAPSVHLTNSVLWAEGSVGANGWHASKFHQLFSDEAGGGSMLMQNNVLGGMGNYSTSNNDSTYGANVGGTPSVSTTDSVTGNVNLCGSNGVGTVTLAGLFLDNGNIASMSITHHNNTGCVLNFTLSDTNPLGSGGVEGGTVASGTVASVNSDLFFRNDAGGPIAEFCDATFSACSTTPFITIMENNAVVNTNTASAAICSAVADCAVTGPENDVTIENRPPVLVEPGRSLPLFDSEYLTPAGLLLTSSYSATAWATSTSYSVGNYVSDSQSGVFGGKTTYWRCIQAHTSGSTNRPVTGYDSSNPFYGQAGYWEPAFMPWLRSAVLAGTTYTDGALNVNGVYVIGLLNAWLRQGMTSMEPRLWNGCLNGAECGAVQLTAIVHIPPPAMVN